MRARACATTASSERVYACDEQLQHNLRCTWLCRSANASVGSLREWCGNVARIISSPLQCVSYTGDPKGHCGRLRITFFKHLPAAFCGLVPPTVLIHGREPATDRMAGVRYAMRRRLLGVVFFRSHAVGAAADRDHATTASFASSGRSPKHPGLSRSFPRGGLGRSPLPDGGFAPVLAAAAGG